MTLNGHILNKQEITALRTAITVFRMGLTKEINAPNVTNKPQMLIIANGYEEHLARLAQLLVEDQ